MVLVGRFENTVSRCIYRPWDDLEAVKNEGEKKGHVESRTVEA